MSLDYDSQRCQTWQDLDNLEMLISGLSSDAHLFTARVELLHDIDRLRACATKLDALVAKLSRARAA